MLAQATVYIEGGDIYVQLSRLSGSRDLQLFEFSHSGGSSHAHTTGVTPVASGRTVGALVLLVFSQCPFAARTGVRRALARSESHLNK